MSGVRDSDWVDLRRAYCGTFLLTELPLVLAAPRLLGGLVYLASPFARRVTGPDGGAVDRRQANLAAAEAAGWAADCARYGVTVVAPIPLALTMCLADPGLDPLDQAFWTNWCRPMLRACHAVVVPPIAGWARSQGVLHEVRNALDRQVPVVLLAEDGR